MMYFRASLLSLDPGVLSISCGEPHLLMKQQTSNYNITFYSQVLYHSGNAVQQQTLSEAFRCGHSHFNQ